MSVNALKLVHDRGHYDVDPARVSRGGKHSDRLLAALDAVDRLPAPAEACRRFAALAVRPGVADAALLAVIASDPALTGALMRFANRYSGSSAATPRAALEHLGRVRAARVVRELPTYEADRRGDPWIDAVCTLRAHGLAVGRTARLIARELGDKEPDRVGTVALLHDLGRLVLIRVQSDPVAPARTTPAGRLEAERHASGVDHAAVGGVVARRWSLPRCVSSAIESHHSPEALGDAAIVRLADMLVHHAAGAPIASADLSAAATQVGLTDSALDGLAYDAGNDAGALDTGEPCPLSPRQLELLRGLGQGHQYKELAHALGLSTSTIRSHLHVAYQRLGVSDRAQAVLMCASRGWIRPVLIAAP